MSYYYGRDGYSEAQPVCNRLMAKLNEAADKAAAATRERLNSLDWISGPVENNPALYFSQAVGGSYAEMQPSVCSAVIAGMKADIAAQKEEQRAAILKL